MVPIAAAEGILALCIGVAVLFYAALFLPPRAKRVETPASIPQPPAPWREKILSELAFLEGPFHLENPKEAMARFASLVDLFVRESYGVDSSPLTTTEMIQALAAREDAKSLETVRFLLTESDWVKFSRESSREEHWQNLFSKLRGLLVNG